MNKCKCCGEATTNPAYCSRSCSAKISNKTSRKRKLTKTCKTCQEKIKSGYTYCTDCWQEQSQAKDMTLAEATYKKHHKSSAFALVRARARSVMKDEPKRCTNCGYDKHVEVCHIKAIKDFSPDTLLSVINSKDNLVLLCPNCHWEYDHLGLEL